MDYYDKIKSELVDNEVNKVIKDYGKRKYELQKYYNVGELLFEAGNKYGDHIIKDYSIRLTIDLGPGYSQRSLRNMRQFYKAFQKWQTLSAKLSWSHYCEIMWFEEKKLHYYIKVIEESNLSVRELRERIRCNEYERLPEGTKTKFDKCHESNITEFIKNPILIKNSMSNKEVSEKALKSLILENIELFMNELGSNFSFIGSEFKIKVDNSYNYIDILLYNYKFNCFVVVELKTSGLKKEHIGQVQVYMNYIDKNVKELTQGKTVGIIICKKNNNYVIKYCSDDRIIAREYTLI